MGSPSSGTREPVVTCSKMEAKLYPDTNVSENAQKKNFRRVPGSLGNVILRNGNPDTPIVDYQRNPRKKQLELMKKPVWQ
jgi:hypothetical protein